MSATFPKIFDNYKPKGRVLSEKAAKKINDNIRSAVWEESVRRALVALRYNNGAVFFELPYRVGCNYNKTKYIHGNHESTRMYNRSAGPKADEMFWNGIVFKYTNFGDINVQFLAKKQCNNEIIVSVGERFKETYCCEFRGFRTGSVEELAKRITDFIEAVSIFKLGREDEKYTGSEDAFNKLYTGRKQLGIRPYYFNRSVLTYRDPDSEDIPADVEGYEFDKDALWEELMKYINVKDTMYPSYQLNWSVLNKFSDFCKLDEYMNYHLTSESYEKKTEFLSYVYTTIVNGFLIRFPKKKDLKKYLGYNRMPTDVYDYISILDREKAVSGFGPDWEPFDADVMELKDLVIEINNNFRADSKPYPHLQLFPDNLSDEELKALYIQYSKLLHPDQVNGNERLFRSMKDEYEVVLELYGKKKH